jgi:hypothetical protein
VLIRVSRSFGFVDIVSESNVQVPSLMARLTASAEATQRIALDRSWQVESFVDRQSLSYVSLLSSSCVCVRSVC